MRHYSQIFLQVRAGQLANSSSDTINIEIKFLGNDTKVVALGNEQVNTAARR